MKKIFVLAVILAVAALGAVHAGIPISQVDKAEPSNELFMDMACTAAAAELNNGGKPCGTVIILNGAWKSAGTATATQTAEQVALEKSGKTNLENAIVYTVNEPTTEAYNEICRYAPDAVYFVNPRDAVVAAGVYPASAYDDSKVNPEYKPVPMYRMDYEDAEDLLKIKK